MLKKLEFNKHNTSCFYKLSGYYIAFTKIDLVDQMIYLNSGGFNDIPVRLSDVENLSVTGKGHLIIEGLNHYYKPF